MNKHIIPLLLSLSLLSTITACQNPEQNTNQNENNQLNTINTHQTTDGEDNMVEPTGSSNVHNNPEIKLDFPQQIEDIPYLLHPIVATIGEENKNSKSLTSKDGYEGMNFFYENEPYHYHTHIHNLIFEDITTKKNIKLFKHNNFIINNIFYPYVTEKWIITNKQTGQKQAVQMGNHPLNPQTVNPQLADAKITDETIEKTLQEVIAKTGKNNQNDFEIDIIPKQMLKHFIYQVNEQPNAKPENKKSNLHTQLALYMSDENGKNLHKLHPDNQYLSDTKWMPKLKRFYFITQSDSDGNGIIDHKDKYHNYLINFNRENPEAQSYAFK
ncbi:MAG: hypothetical protein CSA42_05860 [Gammaproteobacteria bacterium]|nr:MAG: hypothetical protein CSA42_05860 [Gammaproteobacteria bacterium]